MDSIKFLTATVLVAALSIPTITQAALVVIDLNVSGDGLITLDTDTGLEWLDLTETRNLNYNYVSSQLGLGGQFEGYRYATKNEVDSLFLAFGLPLDTADQSEPGQEIDPAILSFYSTMGELLSASYSDFFGTYGVINEIKIEGTHDFVGVSYDAQAGLNHYSTSAVYSTLPDDASWVITDPIDYADMGSYLVSTVPVPAAIWLFGSGLIGLVGLARRKVKQ